MRKGVQKIYSEVAPRYEFINHLLTFGMDVLWRKKAAQRAAVENTLNWLDLCSGTGEMAQSLSKRAGEKTTIIASDFSLPMLSLAKGKKFSSPVFFTLADANSLPFSDNTFDLITIAFATRNLSIRREILISHLRDFHRVLKPGGRFLNLETSQPSSKILMKLFHLYARLVVKPVGTLVSGSKAGYSYLAFTIPRFYSAGEFSSILNESGFTQVSCHSLLYGIAAIHMAVK